MAAGSDITGTRRVIVHCGAQKTGSTSLHHFLQKNRDTLADHLEFRTPEKGSLIRRLGRACALYSLRPARHGDELISLLGQLRDELSAGDKVCIISSENIVGAMMGRGGETRLYPALPRIIALFEEYLAPFRPDYVFYTREMAPWKRSVHNQAVKSDGYCETFETFSDETSACGSWAELESDLIARLGQDRVRFFALEGEISTTRPGQQLLRFAGLSDRQIASLAPVGGRLNQSLAPGALEFMRQTNGLGLAGPARRKIAKLVVSNPDLFAAIPVPRQDM